MKTRINKTIKITGKVQGVFFRKSTLDKAIQLGIKGWVRNDRGGSVLTEIEGSSSAVEEMEEWLKKGPENAVVERIDVETGTEKRYTSFEIRSI